MSAAEIKEIVSFVGIFALIIAIALISWSRRKLSGVFAAIITLIAYLCLVLGAIIVIFIVISGPTG
ncbi:MAG TPA: DUF2768 family protein [Pseudogracilibacillus sp.]|nr:DUF2768 family protein [Pseudogracilibacillus sp.]